MDAAPKDAPQASGTDSADFRSELPPSSEPRVLPVIVQPVVPETTGAIASFSTATVPRPSEGTIRVIDTAGLSELNFNFPPSAVHIAALDVDLVMVFSDNSKLILPNLAMGLLGSNPPKLNFEGKAIAPQDLVGAINQVTLAEATPSIHLASSDFLPKKPKGPTAGDQENATGHDGVGGGEPPIPPPPIVSGAKYDKQFQSNKTKTGDFTSPPVKEVPAGSLSVASSNSAVTSPSVVTPIKPLDEQTTSAAFAFDSVVSGRLLQTVGFKTSGSEIKGATGTGASDTNPDYTVQTTREVLNGTGSNDEIWGEDPESYPAGTAGRSLQITYSSSTVTTTTVTISGVPDSITILNATYIGGGIYKMKVDPGNTFTMKLAYKLPPNDTGLDSDKYYSGYKYTFSFEFAGTNKKGEKGTVTASATVGIRDVGSADEQIGTDPKTGKLLVGLPRDPTGNIVNAGDGNDTIHGAAGNDSLVGGGGDDTFRWTGGNDVIDGEGGSDGGAPGTSNLVDFSYIGTKSNVLDLSSLNRIEAEQISEQGWLVKILNLAGNVINSVSMSNITGLWGSNGNDLFKLGEGNKGLTIDGKGGTDTIDYANLGSGTSVSLNLATGSAVLKGTSKRTDTITSISNASGGKGNDTLVATSGNNFIDGGGGQNSMAGGSGNDTYFSHSVNDKISDTGGVNFLLTDAFKTINLSNASDPIGSMLKGLGGSSTTQWILQYGGTDDFVGVGDDANNSIYGGIGNDTIDGGRGNDLLDGGVGYDFLSFAFSTAAINASLANSSVSSGGYLGTYTNFEGLIGSAYSDSLSGDTTANYLYGMAGNDTLFGGDGADTLQGGANSDSIDGGTNSGSGIDMVDYTYTTAALTITLNGASSGSGSSFTLNVASGDLDTVRNVEGILSGGGADSLTGDSLANYIDGGAGNDTIIGGGGADSLFGGAGSDLLRLDWSSINLSKLDAGSGTDTVSFANSTNDITLSGSSFSNLLSNAEYLDFSGTNGTVSLSLGGDDVQKLLTGSSSTSSYAGVLDLKFDALGDSLSLLNNGSYSYWNSSDVNATTGKFNDGTNFSISGSTQQYVYVFDTNHTTLLATLYLHT